MKLLPLLKLRVDAHPDPMMGLMPMFTAIEAGLFARRGIETEFVQRTAVQAIEDMRADRMDITFSGPTLTIMAAEKFNLPSRLVSAAALRGTVDGRHADFMTMMARHGVDIRVPKDFEGKRLAAFALDGGITHSAPLYLFRKLGVDTEAIHWVPMPFHRMPDAMAAGEIDVALCVEPLITVMTRRNLGYPVDTVLGDGSLAILATGDPSLVSNWWTTRAAYARQPELFDLTHEALNEAIDLIHADPERGFDAMARQTGQDSALLRDIGFKSTLFHAYPAGAPEVRAMYAGWVRVLHGAGLLEAEIDVAPFF